MVATITPEMIRQIQEAGLRRPTDAATPPPQGQTCRRCGATFRWERGDDGFVMCLVRPSESCDCGYGRVAQAPPVADRTGA